ncbi:uncharacterized protein N7498_004190 [Penicillium cinerascens]|uniref:Uncharacterized protein n=1 Tax=Penicillium cinerascens TaxID=70096 RepID=A0A9W9N4D2_9EURO|nr:uncharacterized protein N7498_004190 [Penicillium cinerascens]KAJ5212544.1 hypothetical protein N7498_004190 [Penicillium cinerascens]
MPKHDIAMRSMIVTMKACGISTAAISEITGVSARTVNALYNRAIERGFDPTQRPMTMTDAYVADATRSGRPTKQIPEAKAAV